VFGLTNETYKMWVEEHGLPDLAPDLRIRVEPEWNVVTEADTVKLKVHLKNYGSAAVSGTLQLRQPEKNADGILQAAWNAIGSASSGFELAPGDAADIEFTTEVGAGDPWTRHNFEIYASYGGEEQTVSTYVVKAAPFHAVLNKIEKIYDDYYVEMELTVRNYTKAAKEIQYSLTLPNGWSADKPSGTVRTAGYGGTGPHYDRAKVETIKVSFPENTDIGNYPIVLAASDGTTQLTGTFQVQIGELFNLLYNGSMEIMGENGLPELWNADGVDVAAISGTEELPAPSGQKYVKLSATRNSAGDERIYYQEGTKGSVHWLVVDPSKKYEFSFWAKVESGKVVVRSGEARGKDYDWLGERVLATVTAEDNGNEWKHYTVDFVPQPSAGRFRVRFYLEGDPGVPNVLYLDGVMLKEAKISPEFNLIANGGMEQNAGWTHSGAVTVSHIWEDQYGGLWSYRISGPAGGYFTHDGWIPVDWRNQYYVEFYAKVLSGKVTARAVTRAAAAGEPSSIPASTPRSMAKFGGNFRSLSCRRRMRRKSGFSLC